MPIIATAPVPASCRLDQAETALYPIITPRSLAPLAVAGLALGEFHAATAGHPGYCSPALCTAPAPGGVHRGEPERLGGGVRLSVVGPHVGPAVIELVAAGVARIWQTKREPDPRTWREIAREVHRLIAAGSPSGGAR